MGIGLFYVSYHDGGGRSHLFKKYVTTTDAESHWLAEDGNTRNLATATPTGSADNAINCCQAFIKALEFIAPTGSSILGAGADWRESGGPGIVDSTATFTFSNFTPAGGAGLYGPFPTGFVAARSRAVESNRAAWLRMYTTGAVAYQQAMNFDPNDIDPDMADWLAQLSVPAVGNGSYVVWSGYSSAEGDWQGIRPYNTNNLRIGCANG